MEKHHWVHELHVFIPELGEIPYSDKDTGTNATHHSEPSVSRSGSAVNSTKGNLAMRGEGTHSQQC